MRRLLAGIVVLGGLAFAASAHADTLQFNISGSGGGQSGTGLFTVETTSTAGQYLITGITTSAATVSLDAVSSTNLAGTNDNFLFTSGNSGEYFDSKGFSFTTTLQGDLTDIRIFYDATEKSYEAVFADHYGNSDEAAVTIKSVTPAATPEPSSLMLLGTGLLGAFGVAKRRLSA